MLPNWTATFLLRVIVFVWIPVFIYWNFQDFIVNDGYYFYFSHIWGIIRAGVTVRRITRGFTAIHVFKDVKVYELIRTERRIPETDPYVKNNYEKKWTKERKPTNVVRIFWRLELESWTVYFTPTNLLGILCAGPISGASVLGSVFGSFQVISEPKPNRTEEFRFSKYEKLNRTERLRF